MASFFLFSLSFSNGLLNPFYVPGVVLSSKDTVGVKPTWSLPSEFHSLLGRRAVKNNNNHNNCCRSRGSEPHGNVDLI